MQNRIEIDMPVGNVQHYLLVLTLNKIWVDHLKPIREGYTYTPLPDDTFTTLVEQLTAINASPAGLDDISKEYITNLYDALGMFQTHLYAIINYCDSPRMGDINWSNAACTKISTDDGYMDIRAWMKAFYRTSSDLFGDDYHARNRAGFPYVNPSDFPPDDDILTKILCETIDDKNTITNYIDRIDTHIAALEQSGLLNRLTYGLK